MLSSVQGEEKDVMRTLLNLAWQH